VKPLIQPNARFHSCFAHPRTILGNTAHLLEAIRNQQVAGSIPAGGSILSMQLVITELQRSSPCKM
jgi:hypothetical protein